MSMDSSIGIIPSYFYVFRGEDEYDEYDEIEEMFYGVLGAKYLTVLEVVSMLSRNMRYCCTNDCDDELIKYVTYKGFHYDLAKVVKSKSKFVEGPKREVANPEDYSIDATYLVKGKYPNELLFNEIFEKMLGKFFKYIIPFDKGYNMIGKVYGVEIFRQDVEEKSERDNAVHIQSKFYVYRYDVKSKDDIDFLKENYERERWYYKGLFPQRLYILIKREGRKFINQIAGAYLMYKYYLYTYGLEEEE